MNFRKNSMHPKYTFFSLNFTPFGYINFVLTYPDNILTHLYNPSLLAPKFPRKAAVRLCLKPNGKYACMKFHRIDRSISHGWNQNFSCWSIIRRKSAKIIIKLLIFLWLEWKNVNFFFLRLLRFTLLCNECYIIIAEKR